MDRVNWNGTRAQGSPTPLDSQQINVFDARARQLTTELICGNVAQKIK